jgi:hypothetical protein
MNEHHGINHHHHGLNPGKRESPRETRHAEHHPHHHSHNPFASVGRSFTNLGKKIHHGWEAKIANPIRHDVHHLTQDARVVEHRISGLAVAGEHAAVRGAKLAIRESVIGVKAAVKEAEKIESRAELPLELVGAGAIAIAAAMLLKK